MAFYNNSQLVNQLVQVLADTAPQGWTKFVFYFEYLEDKQIGLRNTHTGLAFGGKNFDIRLDDYSLGGSMAASKAMKALYSDSRENGDHWVGVRLVLLANGKFRCRFFYDETPLLCNDENAVENLLSEGLSELQPA